MAAEEAKMTAEQHSERIADMLREAQRECRADIERVDDPKAQALFETLAEVLEGEVKALDHYRQRSEKAWR